MPLILGALALLGVGGLAFKTVTDEFDDTVEKSGTNLLLLAAAGLGLYLAYKAVSK